MQFFKLTATQLGTSARVLLAQVRGVGVTGEDDEAESMDSVEVLQPLGLDVRPVLTDDTELIGVREGPEIIGLFIIDKSRAKLSVSPELEEGETRLSGAKEPSCMIRMMANGDVVVIPKSGQKVFLGGDSSTQAMLMGDDVTQRLNDLKEAVNNCRSDINTIKSHTHTYTYDIGTSGSTSSTTGSSSSLTSLPTANTVTAAPAQSTVVENK